MRNKVCRLAGVLLVPLALHAETLNEVLARMDAAGPSFRAVKAHIRKVSFTAVINDETVETGVMSMARSGSKSQDIRMRIEFSQPDARSVAFEGNKGEIYYPKINTVHEYDLGKHRSLVEQFLLLGFGSTGKELAKDYTIRLIGGDEVAGAKTSHLELTPKSAKTRERLVKVELWIAAQGGHPVQQKFYWPSEDTTTITYTDIELNPKLDDSDLALNLPPGVKREYPQR